MNLKALSVRDRAFGALGVLVVAVAAWGWQAGYGLDISKFFAFDGGGIRVPVTLTSMNPSEGPVGTQVMILAEGLGYPGKPVRVHFGDAVVPGESDGRNIRFQVPTELPVYCPEGAYCILAMRPTSPGPYDVSVEYGLPCRPPPPEITVSPLPPDDGSVSPVPQTPFPTPMGEASQECGMARSNSLIFTVLGYPTFPSPTVMWPPTPTPIWLPTPTVATVFGATLKFDLNKMEGSPTPGRTFSVPVVLDTDGLAVTGVKLIVDVSGGGYLNGLSYLTDDFPELLSGPSYTGSHLALTVGSGTGGGKKGESLVVAFLSIYVPEDAAMGDYINLVFSQSSAASAVGYQNSVLKNMISSQFTISKLVGDADGNNRVDIFDYNLVVSNFGSKGNDGYIPDGDLDRDGDVDIFDYNLVVSNFGQEE